MKVFATLATILGVAYATPEADAHMGSMRSGLQLQNNVVPNLKMRLSTPYQALTGPTQYHLQDEFGNFEYAYANQESKKMEKGNDMSVRGQYAYIMSDGVLRRVDYIANNDGFHILQDNADSSRSQDRIKRSVQPDLIQTRMTSFMDSSSLRDNSMVNPNMFNMMSRDMASNNRMQGQQMNDMSSNRNMYNMMDRSSNMMGQDMMGRNMMGQDMVGHNMMKDNLMGHNMINENMVGRNMMYENMMGRNMMTKSMMGRNMMTKNMMGRDMSSNMMNQNMMGQDMHSIMNKNMVGDNIQSNMMGHDMSSNMMGQEMSANMMGRDMSPNMIGNRMNAYAKNINSLPLGQRNTMRMEIEQIPQPAASNRFF